ncbi:MAG: endonuclease III domain-containing protein [Candidatus Krumholzibacteriota bacterium]|nr:endonuclease III domain-containing protein [Candidatus Krumholzibacteriota bacterium]
MDRDPGEMLREIYDALLGEYGPRKWWPVTPVGGSSPRYTGGPETEAQRFEVAVGALLTQNTAWENASRAIENLHRAGLLDPGALAATSREELAAVIKPCGYYNQKADRLKRLAALFAEGRNITREALLSLNGIGPETADSIMLYSYGERFFVVDAYTRRIFSRLGLVTGKESYEELRLLFERHLPRRIEVYQEYHALIVEHGKRFCRSRPLCSTCPLTRLCPAGQGAARKNI